MKNILIILVILLISTLLINSPAYAQLQFGIETQSQNDEYFFYTLQADWWFQKNLAFRGDYSWNERNLGLGVIYQLKLNSISPYLGISEYDLNHSIAPEASWDQKLMVITGVEWSLNKIKNGLSVTLEAKLNVNDILGKNTLNSDFSSGWGLSLKYRLPDRNPNKEASDNYNKRNVNLLGKLITLEAKGEPFEGQVAVGAVVLNRVRSSKFPDSILEVLYEPGQFSTVRKLKKTTPNDTSLRAAQKALSGDDPSHGALYFYNPRTCSEKSRRYIRNSHFQITAKIGRHVFYK